MRYLPQQNDDENEIEFSKFFKNLNGSLINQCNILNQLK
jgi:hypothetical protein